jgi:hypothetical protein
VGEDAGIGGFWAVAMMVDISRNVRSRRMGGRVLGEKDNSFGKGDGPQPSTRKAGLRGNQDSRLPCSKLKRNNSL